MFFCVIFAQQKPSDTANISIRKDYALPNPTRYEAFYDVKQGCIISTQNWKHSNRSANRSYSKRIFYIHLNNSLKDYYQQKAFGGNLYKEDKKESRKERLNSKCDHQNKIFETILGAIK